MIFSPSVDLGRNGANHGQQKDVDFTVTFSPSCLPTKNPMLRSLIALAGVACFAIPAGAFPQFQKEFIAKYADGTDEAYTELVKKDAKCYVCHQGKKKKNRNTYGEALHEYLGKKDKKDVEKIVASLEKVAAESSDPSDPDAPTFGELIADGKLPGGTLDEMKTEPEGEAESEATADDAE